MSDQRIICGPLAVDVAARLATRNGEPLAIGHRGVALLAMLLRRPGEVLTKTELMDAAWGGAVQAPLADAARQLSADLGFQGARPGS